MKIYLVRLIQLAVASAGLAVATLANASSIAISAVPMAFEPNEGQAPASVRYLVRNGEAETFFEESGIHLLLPRSKTSAVDLGLEFLGANRKPAITGLNSLAGHSNYLLGNDPSRWLRGLANFGKVKYEALYPGTDLMFYGNGHSLEHDFEISPGADPSRIAFRLTGATGVHLSHAGEIQVDLPSGVLFLRAPSAYQDSTEGRKAVKAQFLLGKDGTVSFQLGSFDRKEKLVIDPVLSYATYLDKLDAPVAGIAVDTAGDTYVTGYTFNGAYPVTNGVFEPVCPSCPNGPLVFVTKFDPTGNSQIYSTFLGGSNGNQSQSIAVDSAGNAVVTGFTSSSDFPIKNPVSPVNVGNGGYAAFVSSLTSDGSALNYSSVLGSGGSTYAFGVAVDLQGNAYITGSTGFNSSYPTTPGALNTPTQNSQETGFVSKFTPTGSLAYSALVGEADAQGGGSGPTGPDAIAVDSQGSAYITGGAGILWPVTGGVYASKFPSGSTRAVFVSKLASDGSRLNYSTFVGPGEAIGIALDQNDNAFLAGVPDSSTFPLTSNAWNSATTFPCCSAFFSEVSANGAKLLYSSFFPGQIHAMTLDSTGNIYLVGQGQPGYVPLQNPLVSVGPPIFGFQTSSGFISEFDPTGTTLKFSTLFGDLSPGVSAITTDAAGKAHVAGTTVSGIYTTPGAFLGSVTPPPPNVEFTYGYTALIDANQAAPSLCFNYGLYFGYVAVNTVQQQTLQLANCGNAPLTVQSVTSSDPAFTIPAQTNQCSMVALQPGATCNLQIAFAPTAAQGYSAVISFTSNTSIPVTNLAVNANGAVPKASITQGLSFNPALVGQTAPPSFAFLQNLGQAALTIDLTHTTITGDFAILPTSNCTATVPVYSGCTFIISFTPTAAGTRTGVLTVPTNDPANPLLTTTLTGTGYTSYPAPTVTSLLNPSYPVNGAGMSVPISVVVSGTNFFPASVVTVDGEPQTTSYVDSNELTFILDPALLANMGQLPVSVSTPAPGGGVSTPYPLIVYISLPLSSSALISEPVSGLLFAAIPASAINNANTIIPIDPLTGNPKTPIAVAYDPNLLAVSADGSKLYVASRSSAQLQRINLTSMQVEKTFSLPIAPDSNPSYVTDMQVVPGSPDSVVVALTDNNGYSGDGVALYDAGGLVNSPVYGAIPGTQLPASITFAASPSTAYALPGTSTFFSQINVSSTGLSYTASSAGLPSPVIGSIVRTDGTLLYTNSGQVWDPSTQKLLGTYTNPAGFTYYFMPSVVPDPSSKRTFFLNNFATYSQYGGIDIEAYSNSTYNELGTVPFLGLQSESGQDLVRWGADGFAFRSYDIFGANSAGTDQILILRSSLTASTASPAPTPVLTSVAPNQVATGGADFVLQVIGSGFTPASVVQVNGSVRETTYVNGTTLSAFIPASDIAAATVIQITVATPTPGGGTSAAVPVAVSAGAGMPSVVLTPASLIFGTQTVGSSGATQVITLRNAGNGSLIFASGGLTITGSGSASFLSMTTCGTSLAAAASCTISVTLKPIKAGAIIASLSIADNAAGSPQTVALSGTGVGPNTSGLQFIPLTPCRVVDTRGGIGLFGGPGLSAGSTREFDIPQSSCGIPTSAVAYSLNVTVAPNGSLNYLTMWPAGLTQPNVSTLNSDGRIKANAAITPAGSNGGVEIFVSDATNVILDIDGYFVPAGTTSALAFYPVTPCRVSDTRNTAGPLGGPFIAGNTHRDFPVQSSACGLPSNAQAYSLNVTAVPHTTLNYLTAWPAGQSQPNVSTLNSSTGAVAANAAIVPAASNGDVSIFVSDDADVILDVNGYFAAPTTTGLSLYTTTPCRIVDTRSAAGPFNGVLPVAAQTSACAPPAVSQAYVLNATVVPPGPLTYLTLWPNGQTQPYVSTLNAIDGAITSNMAIVPNVNGTINVFSSDPTDAILDISSYFAP